MTEDDAKRKWCPFAKRLPYGSAADAEEIARQGIHPDYAAEMAAQFPCIGGFCMAWRWTVEPVVGRPPRQAAEDQGPGADPRFLRRIVAAVEAVVGDGFCGLAGRPS